MKILRLNRFPILKQLQIEECLMKNDKVSSWLILNHGSPRESIVMGISGVPEKLLNKSTVIKDSIPIIKRFTGGGTVFIDENTLFSSFVAQNSYFNQKPFPKDIMRWSEAFYKNIFTDPKFSLTDDDYVFQNKKFGGNAQYITGGKINKFVHHTSFLYDFDPVKMSKYLLLPEKRPKYRNDRAHEEFLTTMRYAGYASMEEISELIVDVAKKLHNAEEATLEEAESFLKEEDITTRLITL
jgi:lipoate-protein ligase A